MIFYQYCNLAPQVQIPGYAPKPNLNLEVSMFNPTREHDTNPTRVFSG